MVGVTTTRGTVLKGRSTGKVANFWSRSSLMVGSSLCLPDPFLFLSCLHQHVLTVSDPHSHTPHMQVKNRGLIQLVVKLSRLTSKCLKDLIRCCLRSMKQYHCDRAGSAGFRSPAWFCCQFAELYWCGKHCWSRCGLRYPAPGCRVSVSMP